jgi:hypothetical protein
MVEDGQARDQIRGGNGRALAHLYSVLVNEFILLHSGQDASEIVGLTSEQFHGVVDGALRGATSQ